MPFKSKAHKRKMRELLAKGTITLAQYEEVAAGTPDNLPERAGDEDASPAPPPTPAKKVSPFW